MSELVNQLKAMGFQPAFGVSVTEEHYSKLLCAGLPDDVNRSLATIKGLPGYIPPMIPSDVNWEKLVQIRVAHSFQHLIADVWTQILIAKMDAKERPLYILWDKQVPVPTPATALAWLLLCEVWPMPTHREFDSATPLRKVFPHQPFMLPQSTQYGFAGTRPTGFARGGFLKSHTIETHESLSSLFVRALHRTDRENMALVAEHHPIHRPHRSTVTGYGFHLTPGFEREYSLMYNWPNRTNIRADYGYGAHELWESEHSHYDIRDVRKSVMAGLVNGPGFPTHKDNLHNATGGHIRFISEEGLHLHLQVGDTKLTPLPWTPDEDSIKIEHGLVIRNVPPSMPRTWFGFTKTGDDNEDLNNLSAAQIWASTYGLCRHYAIDQLMNPIQTTGGIHDNATDLRGMQLKKAGRIKTKQTSVTHFADAFKKALNQTTPPEIKGDK